MKRRILASFLALVMALSLLPGMALATEGDGDGFQYTYDRDSDGTNDSWDISSETNAEGEIVFAYLTPDGNDSSYALHIEGSGAMCSWADGNRGTRPWNDIIGLITQIIVGANVTTIGQNAFYGASNLKAVQLNEGLTTIERNAFRLCTNLTSFSIPNSVTSMGNNVLAECHEIETLEIGTGLTKLGEGCLLDCGQGPSPTPNTSLQSVIIPANITEISGGSFRNCTNAILIVQSSNVKATGNPGGINGVAVVDATACTSFEIGNENPGSAVVYVQTSSVISYTPPANENNLKFAVTDGGTFAAETEFKAGTLATPTKEDYIFEGWYAKDGSGNFTGGTVTTPTAGQTYYAKWTECQHANGYTYTGNENTLTQACSSCGHIFGTVTLEAPANLVYDGSVKEASVAKAGDWRGDIPAVEYYSNSVKLESAPVSTGAYTAQVMAEGVTVSVSFTISNPPYIPVTPPTLTKPAEPDEPDTLVIPGALPFVDVSANDWYYEDVAYVYAQGIMTGSTASTFAPNNAMTRAMVWTVLGRMSGEDVEGGTPWYALAQSWAVSAGVSDGTGPNDSITREQLVTMLYRQAGSPEVGVSELALLGRFTDGESVSAWAEEAMAWAVAQGILTGDGDLLNPQASATRAQVAAILARFCANSGK